MPFKEEPLDYSCPEKKKADQSDSIKCTTFNEIKMQTASYTSEVYLYVNHAGSLDVCHNNLCQIEQEDRTIDNKPLPNSSDDSTYCGDAIHDKPTANIPEGSMCYGVYQNEGCKMGQEDSTLYNNPEASIPDDSTCGGVYQNKACNMGQEDYPIYNKPAAKTPEDNTYTVLSIKIKHGKWAKTIAPRTINQQLTHQRATYVVVFTKARHTNGPRRLRHPQQTSS